MKNVEPSFNPSKDFNQKVGKVSFISDIMIFNDKKYISHLQNKNRNKNSYNKSNKE